MAAMVADPQDLVHGREGTGVGDALTSAKAVGAEMLPGKSNYFIGNDPEKWRTNIPSYAKVKHKDVYPGVDMIYYGDHQQLEYDFVVAPGSGASTFAVLRRAPATKTRPRSWRRTRWSRRSSSGRAKGFRATLARG